MMSPRARQGWAPIVAMSLAGALLAGGAAALRMTRRPPAWYAPPDPRDEQTISLAERVEYRLAEEAHRVRPERAPWRLRVTEDQINAWLATRLPQWAAGEHGLWWPRSLGTPQVRIGQEAISVAVDIDHDGIHRYLAATLRSHLEGDRMVLSLESVALGRLRVPGGSVRTIARQLEAVLPAGFLDDPQVSRVMDLLGEGHRIDPSLVLADGRRVRLRDVVYEEGAVVLDCETGE